MMLPALQLLVLLTHIVGIDMCNLWKNEYCQSWRSCSKPCGGGTHSRICVNCNFRPHTVYEDCNKVCRNGHSFHSRKCQCPAWRFGECCETHCKPGSQKCGGNPDNIKCTQCYGPYYPAGYGHGCREISQNVTLNLESIPSKDQDLINDTMSLKCTTGCVFPSPSFTWYYSQPDGLLSEWSSSEPVTDKTDSCEKGEKVYTSTLVFPKHTVFNDNADRTVRFQCGVMILNGTTDEVLAPSSVNVRFAVRVTNLSLDIRNFDRASSINLTAGISETFTCTTSESRPLPTIIWYIGGTEQKRVVATESNLTIIPNLTDNGKQVNCKAFNIQPESEALLSKAVFLYVKERASVDSLYFEGYAGETNVTIDENNVNLQLTCNISGYPASIAKIKFEENILIERVNTNQLIFTRGRVACFHGGDYTCEGTDKQGVITNKTLTLLVNCSPRPDWRAVSSTTCSIGAPVTLTFTAIAYPKPRLNEFKWYKEISTEWKQLFSNSDMQIFVAGLETNLTIFNVTLSNLGQYRLTVENSIGIYNQYYFLIQKDESSVDVDTETIEYNDFKTAAIILGIISVVGIGSSAGIVFWFRRIIKETGRKSPNKPSNKSSIEGFDNKSYGTEMQECTGRVYENLPHIYADLKAFSRDDMTTYDVIDNSR